LSAQKGFQQTNVKARKEKTRAATIFYSDFWSISYHKIMLQGEGGKGHD
jgi:hypothetical protein